MSEKKSEQDLKKSVDETVNQILSAGTVAKAMPESNPANGGEDHIKSGSPLTEEQKAEEAKKAQAAKDDEEKEKKKKDEEDEAKKAMSAKKSDDKDADDKKKKDEDDKSKDKMKKSISELSEILDEDELDLIKTWREECEKEAVVAKSTAATSSPSQMSMNDLEQVLRKAISEQTVDLKKAIDEKETLIKGLNEKIEKLASQPAYDRRSISTLETLEKSGANASGELTKSQVLDKMLELQAAGKGVTSHHIAEFEATRNISDPTVRGIVFRELKVN